MLRGYYTLASEMLTQKRTLNTIGNNMANASTVGYKSDEMVTSTFKDMFLDRADQGTRQDRNGLNNSSVRRIVSEVKVDFSNGSFKQTDSSFDFAILGDGFFKIQNEQGNIYFSRNGNFTLDAENYLVLDDVGRVLDTENQYIQFPSEFFDVHTDGTIVMKDINGEYELSGKEGENNLSHQLSIVSFEDMNSLIKVNDGIFRSEGNYEMKQDPQVRWKWLENSNVDTIDEVVKMIVSQRSLQSCSQVVKMYDDMMNYAVDLGKV